MFASLACTGSRHCTGSNSCPTNYCGQANQTTDTVKVDMNLGGLDGNKENRTPTLLGKNNSPGAAVLDQKLQAELEFEEKCKLDEEQARERFTSAGAGDEEALRHCELRQEQARERSRERREREEREEQEALQAEEALRSLEQARAAGWAALRQGEEEDRRRQQEEAEQRQREEDQQQKRVEVERREAEHREQEAAERRLLDDTLKDAALARAAKEKEKDQAELRSKLQAYLQSGGFKGVNEKKKVKTSLFSSGFTYPLHAAVKANDVKTVELLLWGGALRDLVDSQKNKPLGVARKSDEKDSHKQIIELLASWAPQQFE